MNTRYEIEPDSIVIPIWSGVGSGALLVNYRTYSINSASISLVIYVPGA